jgi:hypothetical protein
LVASLGVGSDPAVAGHVLFSEEEREMWTRSSCRVPGAAAVAALLLVLNACGGGGSGSPSPVPTPTPPPPPQVVASGTGLFIEAEFVGRVPITTTRAGSLEATVDWTFATNDVDVALVRGDCSFDQLIALQCPILAVSASITAKPERIRTDGAAAGAYTLFIENTGPDHESISFQVVHTPSATGVVASRVPQGLPAFEWKTPPRGFVEW